MVSGMNNFKAKTPKTQQFMPTTKSLKDHIQNKKFRFHLFRRNQIDFLQKAQIDCYKYNGSFHEAISSVLVVAQLFSIMPVINIKSKNPLDLYFSWKSFRTLYSIFIIFLVSSFTLITIHWSFQLKLEFNRVIPVIFYASNVYVMIKFIEIGNKWPALIKQWYEAEMLLPPIKNAKQRGLLALHIKLITVFLMMLAIVEHILSTVADFYYVRHITTCPSSGDILKDYFQLSVKQLFLITEYSVFKGLIGRMIGFWCTFSWNFMDLFVMVLSIGLAHHFREINKHLHRMKGKLLSEDYWMSQRLCYRQFAMLCKKIDKTISHITMISFSNNLYFVCVQLLKSLNQRKSTIHAIYFWFSLLYLIGRTLAVSLFAAEIFLQSKKLIEVFRKVPKESWCVEVKRFNEEVTNATVAFSGMRFFYLTRPLVLSVAGTIVTYELVLIQFHDHDESTQPQKC